jgi:hypothetical protein
VGLGDALVVALGRGVGVEAPLGVDSGFGASTTRAMTTIRATAMAEPAMTAMRTPRGIPSA